MLKSFSLIALCLVLFGCQLLQYQIKINATPQINVDGSNHPLSVKCRAYLLKDDKAFSAASYQQLWRDDRQALGDSVLQSRVWIQSPSHQSTVSFRHHPHAVAIGVVALFRNPNLGRYRIVIPLVAFASLAQPITLTINQNNLIQGK